LKNTEMRRMIYRKELEMWYVARKEEYDRSVMTEAQTAEQRRLIVKHRSAVRQQRAEAQRETKEAKKAREEGERVQRWLQSWKETEEQRAVSKRQECWQAVDAPATPAEKLLRKNLKDRAKKHVKDVLRRYVLGWVWSCVWRAGEPNFVRLSCVLCLVLSVGLSSSIPSIVPSPPLWCLHIAVVCLVC